jgi:integrase
MLVQLSSKVVPHELQGVALVDANHIPRYWPAVWMLMVGHQWAPSTQIKRLRYLDNLYEHADAQFGARALEDAIWSGDASMLGTVLESWFVSLRNRGQPTRADEARWRIGLGFVQTVVNWTAKAPEAQLRRMEAKLHRLDTLYSQLHIHRGKPTEMVRSLPSNVVEALYVLLDPASEINPFKRVRTRWLAFVAFVLMLHQGLRRGEALLMPADAVKSARDRKSGRPRYWIDVKRNDYGSANDPRHSKPSIKTEQSIRQIPVSEATARLIQAYSENYRGRPNHSYLLNSQSGKPLSTESLTKMFSFVSAKLPAEVLEELNQRNSKKSVTCHDLRHTCAVVRMNQLLERGDPMPEALQKMRTFFGWSKESGMPARYARAVFESRLATVWNDSFDDRVALLRAIPKGR